MSHDDCSQATLKSYLARRRRALLTTLNAFPPPPAREESSAREEGEEGEEGEGGAKEGDGEGAGEVGGSAAAGEPLSAASDVLALGARFVPQAVELYESWVALFMETSAEGNVIDVMSGEGGAVPLEAEKKEVETWRSRTCLVREA